MWCFCFQYDRVRLASISLGDHGHLLDRLFVHEDSASSIDEVISESKVFHSDVRSCKYLFLDDTFCEVSVQDLGAVVLP